MASGRWPRGLGGNTGEPGLRPPHSSWHRPCALPHSTLLLMAPLDMADLSSPSGAPDEPSAVPAASPGWDRGLLSPLSPFHRRMDEGSQRVPVRGAQSGLQVTPAAPAPDCLVPFEFECCALRTRQPWAPSSDKRHCHFTQAALGGPRPWLPRPVNTGHTWLHASIPMPSPSISRFGSKWQLQTGRPRAARPVVAPTACPEQQVPAVPALSLVPTTTVSSLYAPRFCPARPVELC